MLLRCFDKKHIRRPEPRGHDVWKSWSEGDAVRLVELKPMADLLLAELRRTHSDAWHVMTPDRDYCCKDVNIYSQGGSKGKHQDAQGYGSLVFVFCAGLACNSSVWLGGRHGHKESVCMRSGDCMVFEGKTWHQVHDCIPGSSPFPQGEWLGARRISILVRQKPTGQPQWPRQWQS